MLTQVETLKAMGIEVWTLRGKATAPREALPDVAVPEVSLPVATASSEEPREPMVSQPASASPAMHPTVPTFRFAMLHYGTLGFCLALEEGTDIPRRFCDDVVRVMAAEPQSLKQQIVTWPMLETSGIDQSFDAARQVVTQKFSQMPAKVIVVGSEVVQYFGPLEKAQTNAPVRVGSQSYLLISSLPDILKSADRKRELMTLLDGWQ